MLPRSYMAAHGLNASDVARLLGTNVSCVSRWMNGHLLPSGPNVVAIVQMAKGLITPAEALDWVSVGTGGATAT